MNLPLDLSALSADQLMLLFGADRLRIFQQQVRPLAAHLADYRIYMEAKGSGARHVHDSLRRVRAMVRLCRASTWSHLEALRIRRALTLLRKERPRRKPMGLSTVNHYLHSLKGFCNWMAGEGGRAEKSPCVGIRPFNAKNDLRHARRALSETQVLSLVNAANTGRRIGGISGAERAMTYVLACTTGLRSAEIQSLRKRDFHLDPPDLHVTVRAAYTKNKKAAVQPLLADVAKLVGTFLADCVREDHVFRRPKNPMRAFKIDLAAAGIPYELNGEFVDFHALRHTFVSNLFSSGATPKEAQALARHQDARLTLGRYAHVEESALRAAVQRLPAVVSPAAARVGGREAGSWLDGMVRRHSAGGVSDATDRVG